jgi:hypothetical protein
MSQGKVYNSDQAQITFEGVYRDDSSFVEKRLENNKERDKGFIKIKTQLYSVRIFGLSECFRVIFRCVN